MPTMFNEADRAGILARLDRLTPQTARLWGSLTPAGMVFHLNAQLQNVLGELKVEPRKVPGIMKTGFFHWLIMDSRYVVRYFRKSGDGRLLFGGREIYAVTDPKDIPAAIRRQIVEIYPALKDVEITHGWGGYVGITMPRKPFVREVMPNVISAGGYSGHGVMLSNFVGKLYAETVSGNRDRLKLFEDIKIPAFPGGRRFRAPLLFLALNWYALRDRI